GSYDAIPNGTTVIEKGVPIFPRLDVEEEVTYIKEQMAITAPNEMVDEPEEDSSITIEDFNNVSIQVAEVLACERVPKADKLLKFQLSLGDSERQVLSGIAKYYEPEELIGKKVTVVTNLK